MSPENNTGHPNRLEIILKATTAVGALLEGVFIPIVINLIHEKKRETQLSVQIMMQREQSDSALRSQMFNSLIGSYFGKDILSDPEKQMMYLHLLTLNFQEFFDARPLYEDLDKRVNPEQRKRLLEIARNAADRQVNLLTKPNNEPMEMQLCIQETDDCKKMNTFSMQGQKDTYTFATRILSVTQSQIRVRVSSADEKFNFKTIEFNVSYFDTPFMNNTKLVDGSRFSFVLRNADPDRKMATIEIVVFPEEYMNLRDRPYFDEMLSKLGTKSGASNPK